MDKLVSIITPCYNGEKYIGRYLDSILLQTYSKLELILVNDGSSDKTEEVILSYKEKFISKGIDFKYIYQENSGQAAAINKGLTIFKGDYLTWPDSDDILTPDSVEKKVNFLERNDEYGIVRTDAQLIKEENLEVVLGSFASGNLNKYKETLFLDFITENKVWFAPGCFLVTREALLNAIPNRQIYESRGGQNWQLLLPIFYKYKCGYIDECLYKYVVRENSHSHSIKKIHDQITRCDVHEDILNTTINSMNINLVDKAKYLGIIKEKYNLKRFKLSLHLKEKTSFRYNYKILKKKSLKIRVIYVLAELNLIRYFLK